MSVEMGCDEFSASNGWLDSWKQRYSVKFACLSGESAAVNQNTVDDWSKRLVEMTKDYELKDIFNADETGLCFHALPKQSMVVKGDPRKGIKTAKERITVLLGCSASGEKLKPLVIGRAENPRCLKGVNKASLPVTYKFNRRAWMTASIFHDWLDHLNSKMKSHGRHILLFLDNCGAHPHIQLSNVKLQFLPPNTTSRLQPCDAGVIATFKSHYRKRLLRHLLAQMDDATQASDLAKSVNLLDAIRWVDQSWFAVKPSTIVKCFASCGFAQSDTDCQLHAADEEESESLAEAYQPLLGDVEWQEFVAMDSRIETTETSADGKPTAMASDTRESESDPDSENDQDDSVMSSREALIHTKKLLVFATKHSESELVTALLQVKTIMEELRIKEASKAKQTSIKDFFKMP